ncbi:hypothetical protein Fmac_015366 [Flemingia macrophylla]|uniref:Uncharacterized protein n=1 Tax=Flemingia macrophylla TaxID=520843 RepID=A0ABD1MED1_9FABA
MILMVALKNNTRINWVYVVQDNMLKIRRLMDFKCPYSHFVSRLIEHFQVNVDEEARKLVKDVHDVKDKVLKMMRLTKIDVGWISRDEVPKPEENVPPFVTSEQPPIEQQPPEATTSQPLASPSGFIHGDYKPKTPFKVMVMSRLDAIQATQQREFKELKELFEVISKRLDNSS